jgi:SagB-type dehydrogenase family enzyme
MDNDPTMRDITPDRCYAMKRYVLCAAVLLVGCATSQQTTDTASLRDAAIAVKTIKLPAPAMDGGMPLMEALKARASSRAFSAKPLPLQVLSDLLWAANGVNRTDSGKRTAPSAMNWQEIDVYIVAAGGVFLYEPQTHELTRVSTNDVRAASGMQPFVKDAPINLVYVADLSRIKTPHMDIREDMGAVDAAFISENVYLFCASEKLATVVRGSVDKTKLAAMMSLRPDQKIVLAQTVGYGK